VRLLSSALILTCLLLGSSSWAADTPASQADELISQGFKLRVQGRNAEALDLFTKANALAPSGKTLAQLGSVEAALRRWVNAEEYLEAALSRHDSPWIETTANRALIEQTLAEARKHVGRLRFDGPAGAQVSVDGRAIGVLPQAKAIGVLPGTVNISATAKGFQAFRKDLVIEPATDQLVTIALLPEPVALPPPVTLVQPAQPIEPAPPRSPWRLWTGGGLALAGLGGVGVGIGWIAFDGRPSCDAASGSVCMHVYDTKTLGWVALGAGAASLAVGATLLLWPSEHAPAVSVTAQSIALTGAF